MGSQKNHAISKNIGKTKMFDSCTSPSGLLERLVMS